MECSRMESTMKRYRLLGLLLAVGLLVSGFPGTGVSAAGNWPAGPKKNFACEAAIMMELSTGTVLYEKNSHKQYYPASITKIMTAMLTAENLPMNDIVTFSDTAARIEAGSSTIYSEVGEKLSVEQCMYAIMLESANEVCQAVAEQISGSIEQFVGLMNQRVKELGLQDTHFNNPHGLPDPKHYTSPHDMAVITRNAMQNATFRKVCNTKNYTCAKTNKHKTQRYWINHHEMISGNKHPEYLYKYVIGGKTGYTKVSGNTLVTCAQKDGMELVCVVMKSVSPELGEPNEYTDTTRLLNYGFEKFRKYTVGEDTQELDEGLFNNYGSYFGGEQSPLRLGGESAVVLPKGAKLEDAEQTITYDDNVDIKEGDNTIGHVTYTYQGKTVGSTDIIYTRREGETDKQLDEASKKMVDSEIQELEKTRKEDAKKADLIKKVKNAIAAFFAFPLVRIVLAVLLLGLLVFGLVFLIKNFKLPKIRLRRAKNRVSGGYRSRRGRRMNARRERSAGGISLDAPSRRSHRGHRRRQEKGSSPVKQKRNKGLRYYKKHKNTRESFGKNFFDF